MDMATRTAMEIHHQSSQNPKPAKMGEREQNAAGMLKYVAEQAAPFFQRVDEERFRNISEGSLEEQARFKAQVPVL